MKPTDFHGLLVLDKPAGITSRHAVDRAQRWFPRGTRIGHAGTLDPLATGVLVLCVGSATRLIEYVQDLGKVYQTTIRLGGRSDTDDADGTVTLTPDAVPVPRERIEAVLPAFLGEIQQVPPPYSAAKVTGRRAYDLARQGETVELPPRTVRIDAIAIGRYEWPELDLEVRCGKGTYIRSLARDLGAALGVGGLVSVLRRTAVGPFTPEQAVPLDAAAEMARARLLPPAEALRGLPPANVDARSAQKLRQGQAVPFRGEAGEVAVFGPGGELVGVAQQRGGLLRPVKIIPE